MTSPTGQIGDNRPNLEQGFWHDGSENYWNSVGWYAEEDRRNLVAARPMPGVTHWMPLPKGPPR